MNSYEALSGTIDFLLMAGFWIGGFFLVRKCIRSFRQGRNEGRS
jgi:hypothetical protein